MRPKPTIQDAEPVFPKLFPQPTGANGWEELVRAGDLLRLDPRAWPPGIETASLARQRAALATRPAREALTLVRAGLAKPIVSPRQTMDFATTFPDLALLRALARLMATAIRIAFADGRYVTGCDAIRDGLALCDVPRSEVLIGCLVGVAMQAVVVDRAARCVDAVPQRECDRLIALLRRRLQGPSPFEAGMRREAASLVASLAKMIAADGPPLGALFGGDADDPQTERISGELSSLRADPARAQALLRQIRDATEARLRADLAGIAQPWREPPPVPEPPPGTAAAQILQLLSPVNVRSRDRFVSAQAEERLLAVRLLIRRFVWENDRLPTDLAELKAPDLTLDPFTGDPLVYQPAGPASYRLESVGPPQRDEAGQPSGGRTPVVIWPNRRPGN